MQWSNAVAEQLSQIPQAISIDEALKRRLYSFVDLTSLGEDDTEEGIVDLCRKAQSELGNVAAVCVYPKFVRLVADTLSSSGVQVAAVANFPEGETAIEKVLIEIGAAIQAGATEIDVVFPYNRYLAGEQQYCKQFIQDCKAACGDDVKLKVILETGALGDVAIIADATYDAIVSGADFVKTSTGKVANGATLEAAATMLLVIKHVASQVSRPVGLKVSGGIGETTTAAAYLELVDVVMGREWASPETFRIGASRLVGALLQ